MNFVFRCVLGTTQQIPVNAETLVGNKYDISAKNPNNQNDVSHLPPEEIIGNIKKNDAVISQLMSEVESILEEGANG